jgi:hypothetical protein
MLLLTACGTAETGADAGTAFGTLEALRLEGDGASVFVSAPFSGDRPCLLAL